MKYDKDTTEKLLSLYAEELSVAEISEQLKLPTQSIIAKLSSLGVYKKQIYVNKNGHPPVKKAEYIEMIAAALGVPSDQLESLEKVNKSVLAILKDALMVETLPDLVEE
jgi:hypothetical protein